MRVYFSCCLPCILQRRSTEKLDEADRGWLEVDTNAAGKVKNGNNPDYSRDEQNEKEEDWL